MQLSLDVGTIGFDVPLEDLLKNMENELFQALEYSIENIRTIINKNSKNYLQTLIASSNIQIPQFTCGTGIPANIAISENAFVDSLYRWTENCKLAQIVGINQGSVLVNSTKGDGYSQTGKALSFAELYERIVTLAKIAAKYNIRIALEIVDPPLLKRSVTLWQEASCDNLGLLLDTYTIHSQKNPTKFIQSIPIESIFWVHLANFSRTPSGFLRVFPQEGLLDCFAILSHLSANGYNSVVSLEVYGPRVNSLAFADRFQLAINSIKQAKLERFFDDT